MTLVRTVSLIEQGMAEGLHIGAQCSVARWGEPVAELAIGEAAPGVAMTPDSMMIWFSMSKISCAVAVAQQWERGAVRLDERVAHYLPAFRGGGKDEITLRHLLTHTAGIPWADGMIKGRPWRESPAENLARICAAECEADWVPGRRAAYHPTSGMTVLGAVVSRVDGRSYDAYVRDEIFGPLGMVDSWVGMPTERFDDYGSRIGRMVDTSAGGQLLLAIDDRDACTIPLPGASGRGPMRELRLLLDMLLHEGELAGARILEPVTVAAMTARHRVGLVDETFGIPLDWGLGVAIDSAIMGRHSSTRAFGHGGAQSSVSLADPESGVTISLVCNGMCGGPRHYPRMEALVSAIYEDLGLADGPGRAKPLPTTGV